MPALALPVSLAACLLAGCGGEQVPDPNVCRSNLRLINNAKHHWAQEHRVSVRAEPTAQDLDPYIRGGFEALSCPKGGTYAINALYTVPTCSEEGHELPLEPGGGAAPVKEALEDR
jgi:hypothetical protein